MNFKKYLLTLCFIATFFSISACAENLDEEKEHITQKDNRNERVSFDLSIENKDLSFCVNNLSKKGSASDVFRVFLHTAETFKNRDFEKVNLCFRGENKFILPGNKFKTIGEDFESQNPLYTIRTFPEKVFYPDGSNAYEKHNGGSIYLMRVQMKDFNDMNNHWFMEKIIEEMKEEIDAKRPEEFSSDEEVF